MLEGGHDLCHALDCAGAGFAAVHHAPGIFGNVFFYGFDQLVAILGVVVNLLEAVVHRDHEDGGLFQDRGAGPAGT